MERSHPEKRLDQAFDMDRKGGNGLTGIGVLAALVLGRNFGCSLGLLSMLTGCCGPDENQLRADFMELHPGCTIDSMGASEGDSDNVYVLFSYRCGDSKKMKSSEFLYQRKRGEWIFVFETVSLPEPDLGNR